MEFKLIALTLALFLTACGAAAPAVTPAPETHEPAAAAEEPAAPPAEEEEEGVMMLRIDVNDHVLYAELADNSSVSALTEQLEKGPVTLEMEDYGNFEKSGPLPFTLPENNEQLTTAAGDVILYQGKTLALYYDVNRWSLTRLGRLTDVNDLKSILGEGDVTVTLSLEEAK